MFLESDFFLEQKRNHSMMSLSDIPSQPQLKVEYHDGQNWYSLATENFVLKNLTTQEPCMVATERSLSATYSNGTPTVNATLTSLISEILSIDGKNPSVGTRILVRDQSNSYENGIYVVTDAGSLIVPWVLTRALDYDSAPQIHPGNLIRVYDGATFAASLWMQLKTVSFLGSDDIAFSRISSFVGTQNQINIGEGSDHVFTVSLSENPTLPGQGGVLIPGGSHTERPASPAPGTLRFNTGT